LWGNKRSCEIRRLCERYEKEEKKRREEEGKNRRREGREKRRV
jgi:hypothetical protein